ncbi:hypothetical protein ACFL2A_03765 [Thermodesulfobacteriota bacterium]
MPITNFPFLSVRNDSFFRPMLLIKITNPDTGKSFNTVGQIDTGADECAIPAGIADLLGHKLKDGNKKDIRTGNGITQFYTHKTTFEIFDISGKKLVLTIKDTPVDYGENLSTVLLGVNNFLSNFVLTIDYPKQNFSIKHK